MTELLDASYTVNGHHVPHLVDYFGPKPAHEYHADLHYWSRGMLMKFRERRRVAHACYIARDQEAPPEDKITDAMRLGSLVHASLLDPEERKLFIQMPEKLLSEGGGIRTNQAKAFRNGHEANGVTVLKEKEFTKCERMLEAAKNKLKDWLDLPSRREHSIYWTNPETGIKCRCRPDWLIDLDDRAIAFDFKTTEDASPDAFVFRAEGDMWFQRAHYVEGIKLATGKPVEWYFVVLEAEFPFACQLSAFSPRTCELGDNERLKTLRDLETCIRLDDWSEPFEKKINEIDLRPWKITKTPFSE